MDHIFAILLDFKMVIATFIFQLTGIRHAAVRLRAASAVRKAAKEKSKPGKRKRVEELVVGSLVTVYIPPIDRHSTDQRRLPGIIVEKLGESHTKYRIRLVSSQIYS